MLLHRHGAPHRQPAIGLGHLARGPAHRQAHRRGIGQTAAHQQAGQLGLVALLGPDKSADPHRIPLIEAGVWLAAQQSHPVGEAALGRRQQKVKGLLLAQFGRPVGGEVAEGRVGRDCQHQQGDCGAQPPAPGGAWPPALPPGAFQLGAGQHQQHHTAEAHQGVEHPPQQQIQPPAEAAAQQHDPP